MESNPRLARTRDGDGRIQQTTFIGGSRESFALVVSSSTRTIELVDWHTHEVLASIPVETVS